MCAVTSATVSFPPVKRMAKFLTPQRSAKNSVCPGNLNPTSYIRALWIGPVTIASSSPRRTRVTASSSAAAAARAVSCVGWPNEHLGYLPMILYWADFATRPDFKARSTISGPMPAQSPRVIPIRSFFLLMLLLVIVIEFARWRTSVVATDRDIVPRCPDAAARHPYYHAARPVQWIRWLERLDELLRRASGSEMS